MLIVHTVIEVSAVELLVCIYCATSEAGTERCVEQLGLSLHVNRLFPSVL
jgi:hypothetical protein